MKAFGGKDDNKDKSLRGLMVALAITGAIAGSAILFAYVSSGGSIEAAGTATSEAPEPVIVEKVVEKPIYIEKVRYVNKTVEVEKPVYIYVNNTEDDSQNAPQPEPDQRQDKHEEKDDDDVSDEQDTIPERLRDLLDEITDFDDDEDEKDDGNKDNRHNKDDDD